MDKTVNSKEIIVPGGVTQAYIWTYIQRENKCLSNIGYIYLVLIYRPIEVSCPKLVAKYNIVQLLYLVTIESLFKYNNISQFCVMSPYLLQTKGMVKKTLFLSKFCG